jgi:hypothetical protein
VKHLQRFVFYNQGFVFDLFVFISKGDIETC